MIRRYMTIGTAIALALALTPVSASSAPPSPFRGSWYAVDVDGSSMRLSFGGGGESRRVTLYDDNATGGVCDAGNGRALARGTGLVDDDTIAVDFASVRCLSGAGQLSGISVGYAYDVTTDTLSDGAVTWFRPGTGPSEPFLGAWKATDEFDGSNMTLSFAVPFEGQAGERTVTLSDDNATGGVCLAGEGRALGSGVGVIDGNRIAGTFDALECRDGETDPDLVPELTDIPFEFVHDPAGDTLNDGATTWHRP